LIHIFKTNHFQDKNSIDNNFNFCLKWFKLSNLLRSFGFNTPIEAASFASHYGGVVHYLIITFLRIKMVEKKGSNKELIALLEIWINVEKNAMEATTHILSKIDDKLLRALIGDIRGDSRKHKELLELVMAVETKGTQLMQDQADELLASFISTHALLEENAVEVAENAIDKVSNPISRLIINYILQDEKKHDFLMDALKKYYQEK
jgi:rubrerythrin